MIENVGEVMLEISGTLFAIYIVLKFVCGKNATMIERVGEFSRLFGAYIAEVPGIPPDDVSALRASLITEEYNELIKAMGEEDVVAVSDAIADLHYVLSGTALAYGIPEDEVFAEVHRSNMDKAEKDGTVLRRLDGKILKASHWTPPEIADVLRRFGWVR